MIDPDVLARISPAELGQDEDPLERFTAESAMVGATTAHIDRSCLAGEITQTLREKHALRVALTADLDAHRRPLSAHLVDAGFDVSDYETISRDRGRVRDLDATVTGCLAAVAATGSIVTGGTAGRGGALVAPLHVCVVERRRLFPGLRALMRAIPDLGVGSLAALQSGPSRTADIEKTLILGMHGPKHVHVIVVEDDDTSAHLE